ncbi:MAG: cation-transporting P-type ATPase [Firmicutes bacterium]|nr:cation-transporting P-type ATPase [Bacillota bacterium]
MEIFRLNRDEVYSKLNSSPRGLSEDEAKRRLDEYGPNKIEEVKGTSLILKFISNFYHLFAVLLWVGAALAFIGGLPELGYSIIAVIVINAIFSFWQEYKAEKATEALKKLLPSYSKVLRDGAIKRIPVEELVPGDVIVLEEGDNISADARLVEEFEMRTINATLTGESAPVRRTSDPVLKEGVKLIESPNIVFAGTSVARGSGRAVVYATGARTEFGKIAGLTQRTATEFSPLQKEMIWITRIVAILAITLGIIFFILGSQIAGLSLPVAFLFSIGIIVANVPEGLLPTVTLSLALGVQRMARKHALIKKLSAVETLGSTNVICTDKTGTLTQNEMTVREIWADRKIINVGGVGYEPKGDFTIDHRVLSREELRSLDMLFMSAAFCNTSRLIPPGDGRTSWSIIGDPTEAALLVAAKKAGFDIEKELKEHPRVYLLPFESARKMMSSIHRFLPKPLACVKGAPKEILGFSTRIRLSEGIVDLTDDLRQEIITANDSFARRGLRVLAVAYRELPPSVAYKVESAERDLVFLGLMAMQDPPRPEVEQAVNLAQRAGIKIIMITGDYGLTAESIARKIGIVKGDVRIITGSEIDKISDKELSDIIFKEEVIFARISPEHKTRIVSVLKDRGQIVAVTGDGVNDAPALKRADIGVAMGIAGTDVAKEAAEMVLTDDNFASIVYAVEEGRAVYDNIRRFITYIFASNVPEMVPFILFVMFGIPLPLRILQILAVDLGTDIVPALALGSEAPEPDVMDRPPRPQGKRILDFSLIARAYLFLGAIEATVSMLAYYYAYYTRGWRPGEPLPDQGANYMVATTMVLASIVAMQIGNGFAVRTERTSILQKGFFSNRFYLWGIVSELVIIFLLVYTPFLQPIFNTAPLRLTDWLFLFAFTPLILIADEIRKWIARRYAANMGRKAVKGQARKPYKESHRKVA